MEGAKSSGPSENDNWSTENIANSIFTDIETNIKKINEQEIVNEENAHASIARQEQQEKIMKGAQITSLARFQAYIHNQLPVLNEIYQDSRELEAVLPKEEINNVEAHMNLICNKSENVQTSIDQKEIRDQSLMEAQRTTLARFQTYIQYDLPEMKEIYHESRELEAVLSKEEINNVETHIELIYNKSMRLEKLLDRKVLLHIYVHLSNLDVMTNNELKSLKMDLYFDIDMYYKEAKISSSKYVEDFKNFKTHKTLWRYKQYVGQFCYHIEYTSKMMVELHRRLAGIMQQFDSDSIKTILYRNPTVDQASNIVKRCRDIYSMFSSNIASKLEFDEMIRLNRKMLVVLKEKDFLTFSATHTKRYEVIKKLVIMKNEHNNEDPLVSIVLKMHTFEGYVNQQCNVFLEKCMKNSFMFQDLTLNNNAINYCSTQCMNAINNLMNLCTKIEQEFDIFVKESEEIKALVQDAWKLK